MIKNLTLGFKSQSKKSLDLRESKSKGVYIDGLSYHLVNNLKDIEKIKTRGDNNRTTGSTQMNIHSSRSHSIFTVTIEVVEKQTLSTENESSSDAKIYSRKKKESVELVRVGRIDLVDLAGSERQVKSMSSGMRLKEASQINLSLTCLALVIRALTDDKSSHVPYRNSKLTRLLSSSLGGNSKTLLLACISPAKASLEETLSTLRFASRAKKIKNKATINEDTSDALLRQYQQQIKDLKSQLDNKSESVETSVVEINSTEKNDTNLDQLKLLKGKIIVGGENLLDKVEIHDKLLEATKLELDQRK